MPKISILILTYNSSSYINKLFNSLFDVLGRQIHRGVAEIIIVDNKSTDETIDSIKNYFKNKEELFSEDFHNRRNVILYASTVNGGYAKGINKAATIAIGDILLVINPDAEVIEFDFDKIVEEFENNKKMAIAGFPIVDFDNQREKTAGNFFNTVSFFLYAIGFDEKVGLRFSPKDKRRVDYISGGFVAFRKSAFTRLNGYDEDYFMYVEDMDICYRAKGEDMQTFFLPLGKLKHKGQGSSSREFAIVNIYKGLQIFYKKHGSLLFGWYVKNLLSIKAALIIFIGTLVGKKELVATYTKALKTIV